MLNSILTKTISSPTNVEKYCLRISGKIVERFDSFYDAIEFLKTKYPTKPISWTEEDGKGVIWESFLREDRQKKFAEFTVIKEAQDKQDAIWQAETVLNYIEDLFNRAGKTDLVVAREGPQLLLKVQGRVFRVDVEKVM
jgi:hypothetical protein